MVGGPPRAQQDPSWAPFGSVLGWRYGFLFLVLATVAGLLLQTYLAASTSEEDYTGAWEYRYGASPLDDQGRLLWALPDDTSEGWRETTEIWNPTGRGDSQTLWLRTRFETNARQPLLHFRAVDQICAVYALPILDCRDPSRGGVVPKQLDAAPSVVALHP